MSRTPKRHQPKQLGPGRNGGGYFLRGPRQQPPESTTGELDNIFDRIRREHVAKDDAQEESTDE